MLLKRELEAFRRALPGLLDQEGRFALVRQDEVAGTFDTYEQALEAGYSRFQLEPFLVKQIEAEERVRTFFRDLGRPCRA